MIRQGTTPTIKAKIPTSIPLTEVTELWFTIKQGDEIIVNKTKTECTINGQNVSMTLGQEDTLNLESSMLVKAQIRLLVGTTAYASNIVSMTAEEVLKGGVIGE